MEEKKGILVSWFVFFVVFEYDGERVSRGSGVACRVEVVVFGFEEFVFWLEVWGIYGGYRGYGTRELGI